MKALVYKPHVVNLYTKGVPDHHNSLAVIRLNCHHIKTKDELFAEADKCMLLCANCHAEEHIVHENKLVVSLGGEVPGSYPDEQSSIL